MCCFAPYTKSLNGLCHVEVSFGFFFLVFSHFILFILFLHFPFILCPLLPCCSGSRKPRAGGRHSALCAPLPAPSSVPVPPQRCPALLLWGSAGRGGWEDRSCSPEHACAALIPPCTPSQSPSTKEFSLHGQAQVVSSSGCAQHLGPTGSIASRSRLRAGPPQNPTPLG